MKNCMNSKTAKDFKEFHIKTWEQLLKETKGAGWLQMVIFEIEKEKKLMKKKPIKKKSKEEVRFIYNKEY